jgi:pyruvate/2-oxoglutarate/acetoin dehydrogenase E1 component
VAQRAPGKTSVAPGSVEETAAWLAGAVRDGDVVLVMGGGRSYRIGELLLELLEAG